MDKGKNKKNNKIKCLICENYNKDLDYCYKKQIENCSKAAIKSDFSQCEDYLINQKLVMF